jgi:hypothetical protein
MTGYEPAMSHLDVPLTDRLCLDITLSTKLHVRLRPTWNPHGAEAVSLPFACKSMADSSPAAFMVDTLLLGESGVCWSDPSWW